MSDAVLAAFAVVVGIYCSFWVGLGFYLAHNNQKGE